MAALGGLRPEALKRRQTIKGFRVDVGSWSSEVCNRRLFEEFNMEKMSIGDVRSAGEPSRDVSSRAGSSRFVRLSNSAICDTVLIALAAVQAIGGISGNASYSVVIPSPSRRLVAVAQRDGTRAPALLVLPRRLVMKGVALRLALI